MGFTVTEPDIAPLRASPESRGLAGPPQTRSPSVAAIPSFAKPALQFLDALRRFALVRLDKIRIRSQPLAHLLELCEQPFAGAAVGVILLPPAALRCEQLEPAFEPGHWIVRGHRPLVIPARSASSSATAIALSSSLSDIWLGRFISA
jgi:hypothetical protein